MKMTHSLSIWPLTDDGQFADTEPAHTTARTIKPVAEQQLAEMTADVCRYLTGYDAARFIVSFDEDDQDGHPVCVEIRTI